MEIRPAALDQSPHGVVDIEHVPAIGGASRPLEWCRESWTDERAGRSGHVAQLLSLCQRLELLERLILDLANALTRDGEHLTDFFEGSRSAVLKTKSHA